MLWLYWKYIGHHTLSSNMPNNPANKGTFVLRLRFIKRCCYCSGNILDNILSNQMCHNPANKSAFALNFKHIQLCCDCIGQAVANILSNQECQTIRQIRVYICPDPEVHQEMLWLHWKYIGQHTLRSNVPNNPANKSAFALNLRYIKRCCDACRLYWFLCRLSAVPSSFPGTNVVIAAHPTWQILDRPCI